MVQCLIRLLSLHVHSCDSCFCKSSFFFVFAHRTKESENTVPSVLMINELPLILNVAGYIGSFVRIGWWISVVVGEGMGGGGWAVLGDGKGIRRECKELMASAKVRV